MTPSLKSLNKYELLIGFLFGAIFAIKITFWAILLAPITAYLWACGGAKREEGGNKLYRRLGCAVAPTLAVWLHHPASWWSWLAVPLAFGVLSMGYGTPTIAPGRPDNDEGSLLGRWAYKLAKGNQSLAELYCRAIIFTLLAIAFIPVLVG